MFTAAQIELPIVAMERSMQETLQVMLVIMAPSIIQSLGWSGEQPSDLKFAISDTAGNS